MVQSSVRASVAVAGRRRGLGDVGPPLARRTIAAERLVGHGLPAGRRAEVGTFDRVGAVALNAVLAAGPNIGETVVVFGQGVIGLLATQLLISQGIDVLAVDNLPARLDVGRAGSGATRCLARRTGTSPFTCGSWPADGRGPDRVIELTGSYAALHQAIRCAGVDGTVVAAGFYQGAASALALGEEFHHNRVRLVQLPDRRRADRAAGPLDPSAAASDRDAAVASGRLDPTPLVTHESPAGGAAEAYRLLDDPPPDLMQVILDFTNGLG